MNISDHRNVLTLLILALVLTVIGLSQFAVSSRAQDKPQLPARTGYVNDFAGVLDDATRERLEVMLGNLQQRSGIEFGVATIQTTAGRDIFDVSRDLANEWNFGSRSTKKKSLLLVIAVTEKTAFTQFSRSVQPDLPEGVLGELSQILRGPIAAGRFGQGVNNGVTHVIDLLAKKVGFPAQDIDQAQVASASVTEASPAPSPVDTPAAAQPIVKASNPETLKVTTRPVRVNKSKEAPVAPAKTKATAHVNTEEDDADEAEEVELVLTLPLAERPAKLKDFLDAYPNSKSRPRAVELLISTYAALGDAKLKDGDRAAGLRQLSLAINEAPENISDKLFSGVVAQIPSNLYLRGEREAAFDAARMIETKFGTDARRLLVLSAFYLGIEDGEEAARLAGEAVKLAPDMADAHRALGLGLHIALRLDEAAAEYKRALELDPNTKKATRRSLADLNRAAGKPEVALALYREQLEVEPNDRAARAGVVLSLLDLGRAEEGQKELDSVLANDPKDLILLTGAAYWFAAHNNSGRALELAQRAIQIEPRYTWSQIAMARALVDEKRPLEAERAIRFARQYGKFPTLDYELATILSSLGLYDEAAEVLERSFGYNSGQVTTKLAGRLPAQAESFTELLALERRASIFQFTGAERQGDAAVLKSLFAFFEATENREGKVDEAKAVAAAKEFASGTDKMLAFRQIYAANRLLRLGIGLPTALELTEAARNGVDVALEVPGVTVAVQADELRDLRARALAQGGTPDVPEAPRSVLANLMRGRVEDLTGLTLFKQDKSALALDHFRRAVTILPEGTPAWRSALWHLGTALDQEQQPQEALTYYIRSYNAGDPDPIRRVVIETLYRKVNGSLIGLDERIAAGLATNIAPTPSVETEKVATQESAATPDVTPATPETTPAATPESTPAASPEATPTSTPEAIPAASPVVEAPSEPSPSPSPSSSPEAPAPTPEPTRSTPSDPLANPLPPEGVETRPRVVTSVKVIGKVTDASGAGIANVVMVLISPRGTVLSSTTDVDGTYSFVVTAAPGYRLIPSKEGFTFAPTDKVLTGMMEEQRVVDFVGAAEPAKP
jgi:tetratricopeptide (TPR) repeat protein/uncharacterized membrane protein YgcG